MKIKTNKIPEFKEAIENLKKVAFETNMEFKPEGLTLFGSLAGNTIMNIEIEKDFFTEYIVADGGEKIGINLIDLVTIFKNINSEFTMEEINNVLIITNGKDKYKLPTLNELDIQSRIPDIKIEYSFELTPVELFTALTKLKFAGMGAVSLTYKDTGIIMKTVDGIKEMETYLTDAPEFKGESLFSMEYLNHMASKSSNNKMTLYVEQDKPCIFKYLNDKISTTYIIAPRVTKD